RYDLRRVSAVERRATKPLQHLRRIGPEETRTFARQFARRRGRTFHGATIRGVVALDRLVQRKPERRSDGIIAEAVLPREVGGRREELLALALGHEMSFDRRTHRLGIFHAA